MTSAKFLGLLLIVGGIQFASAIRFVQQGYQILDPSSGRVLPSAYNKGNRGRVTFAPPITDELETNRNPRQIFRNHESASLYPNFNSYFGSSGGGRQPQTYQRFRRYEPNHGKYEIVPYKSSGGSRYQPSTKATYAHKKRQQNPYYGRKKRSAEPEPYTLLDPFTGRNKDNLKTKKKPKTKKNFLFGLPFDLFQDKSSHKPITRTQRRIPVSIESRNPYLSSNGTPIYKYRQKNPLGYGRKKRAAPWVLLDPTTGRTLDQPLEQQPLENPSQSFDDPLQQQFFNPGLRQERQPGNVPNIYLANNGTPLYKYRNKYPHGYHG